MKHLRLKPGNAIEVIWVDSNFRPDKGWMDEEELKDTPEFTIKSVCQYAGEDKEYLYTVADRSQHVPSCTDATGVMRDLKIPLGCIKSIIHLYKKRRSSK